MSVLEPTLEIVPESSGHPELLQVFGGVIPSSCRSYTAIQKRWIAERVLQGHESAASLARRLKIRPKRISDYISILRAGKNFYDKAGRPRILDSLAIEQLRNLDEKIKRTRPDLLKRELDGEYQYSQIRKYSCIVEADVVETMNKRSKIRYVNLLRKNLI